MLSVTAIISALVICAASLSDVPEQFHLNYIDHNTMGVTWVTQSHVNYPRCKLGGVFSRNATTKHFLSPSTGREFYIHYVIFSDLQLNANYSYSCGSYLGTWSPLYSFKTLNSNPPYTFAIFGDLGYYDAMSFNIIYEAADMQMFDIIVHLGDFAYNMNTMNSTIGDNYMRMMDPITRSIPYQVAVGNHEIDENGSFLNYKMRFNVNPMTENMYYSWNVGPVHYVAISSEFYYSDKLTEELINQYYWLVEDLRGANYHRYEQPWIVVYAHRPLYCSNAGCTDNNKALKDGIIIDDIPMFGIERLLHIYGVDFYFSGHQHSYERLYPVYNGVLAGTSYINPKATIYIVGGAAGNDEGLVSFDSTTPAYSAFRSSTYGIGYLTVYNSTHAHWKQITRYNDLLDEIWIIAETHGPFAV